MKPSSQPQQNITELLNPPLGKKPPLSEKEMKNMKMILQFVTFGKEKLTYFYNVVDKESKMGFSSNQRLLFLNVEQKAISYLSKIPQGYLPYTSYQQIAANKVKQKLTIPQVQNFKCNPLKGKISSMVIEWVDKDKNEQKWTFTLGSSKLMNDWVTLVNSVKEGSFDREKYEVMSKINMASPLTGGGGLGGQQGGNNNNSGNGQNVIPPVVGSNTTTNPTHPNNNNNNPPPPTATTLNPQTQPYKSPQVNNPTSNNLLNPNPFTNDPYKQSPTTTSPPPPTFGYNPTTNNTNNPSSNPPATTTTIPLVNRMNNSQQPTNTPSSYPNNNESNLVQSNLVSQSVVRPGNSNVSGNVNSSGMGGELEFSRKPKIPKMGESMNVNNTGGGNTGSVNGNSQLGEPMRNYNTSTAQGGYNNNNNNNNNNNTNTNNPIATNTTNNNPPNYTSTILPNNPTSHSSKTQLPNPHPSYLHPNEIAFQPTPNPRTLANSPSQPPADFVQQLKRKRQKNPQKFILNNQLSQKKFQNYGSYDPELEEEDNFDTNAMYQTRQSVSGGMGKKTETQVAMGQRAPSQKLLNRQNSGDKRLLLRGQQQSPQHTPNLSPQPFSRTNLNMQSFPSLGVKNSTTQLVRQPSRSQVSHLKLNPSSSGVNNNYDEYEMNEDYGENDGDDREDIYRPSTSFPQSTRNLNKIRSDYLMRRGENVGNIDTGVDDKPYPFTAKNDGRLLKNNYVEEQPLSKEGRQEVKSHKYSQPPFQNPPKFDSSQRKREDSMNNLNKLTSTYLSNNPTSTPNNANRKNFPSYNDLWLQTSNPNKKLQIHDQFTTRSQQLVKQIVEEIPYPKAEREFQPVESSDRENLYVFLVENLVVKLHFFRQQESVNGSDDNINPDAPVLYSHTTYHQLKRQFYNYNLILSITGNQGKIKVPLCCLIEYRGILAIVRADIPQSYKQIEPYAYSQQFQALQNMIKVRFLFNTFNCYESQGYRGGEGRFIVLWNLKNLIPGIPNSLKNEHSYFRKELLLQYDQILQDLESSSQAHAFTLKHLLPQLLTKLQSMELQILHSKDLTRQLHHAGLSLSYLPQLYKKTESTYLKRLFMSEIVVGIFTQVVRSQLNHAFAILPAQNMHNIDPIQVDNVIVACAHVLVDQFFSYTQRSENIWKLIVNQASKRYRMIVSKEDVVAGYLLAGIVWRLGVECDFKVKGFLKQKKFFVNENVIPREVFVTFGMRTRMFDMEAVCPTYSKCKELIEGEETSIENYQHLSLILNLKTRTTPFPSYYQPILQPLKTYLANYIPYTLEQQHEHLDIYEYMYQQPPTYHGIKASFLAIKWLIKANQIQKANQVFEIKFHQLSYWLNEYNTAITEFYDFFSMFYASVGDFEESVCLAKSSLINMTKVLGPGALPVADKHYQLGNIFFKINKKNQALKEYNKTKQILINHQKTTIPEYGIILLKISLLCLNFGQLSDCLANAIQAQRIFQNNGGNESQEIECFQILSRVYQITRKPSDMGNLCEACGKAFGNTQNPKIMERMLKIITHPKLTQLSTQQQQSLLPILQRLQHPPTSTTQPTLYSQSFNYLHRLSTRSSIKKKLYYFFENISILSEEINRRDLVRKHTSFSEKVNGDAQEMLVVIEAVGNIVGWGFLVGGLRDGWYD